jgi:hypothetical protein
MNTETHDTLLLAMVRIKEIIASPCAFSDTLTAQQLKTFLIESVHPTAVTLQQFTAHSTDRLAALAALGAGALALGHQLWRWRSRH